MDGERYGPPPPGPAPGRPSSAGARRVHEALAARGFPYRVVELETPVRTAAEAARAVGCEAGRIAKCLVFRAAGTGRPVLVVASGAHRVDEARLAVALGEPVTRADPDFVREATGFGIGGVPPLGHATALEALVDEALLEHETIWAAAGHPNALFRLDPRDLPALTGGRVVALR